MSQAWNESLGSGFSPSNINAISRQVPSLTRASSRNVTKWCVAARVSVDVKNRFWSRTNAGSPTVLSDSTGRAHLGDHPGYHRSLFLPPPSLLASLDLLTVGACMLVPRDVARSVDQIFPPSLALPFPSGVKPLFVRTGEACRICKSGDRWR